MTRSIAVAADALVIGITWWKSAAVWKASKEFKHFKPKLSTLLIQDGTLVSFHVSTPRS